MLGKLKSSSECLLISKFWVRCLPSEYYLSQRQIYKFPDHISSELLLFKSCKFKKQESSNFIDPKKNPERFKHSMKS